jgi:outer membrane protein assembly factor BamA
MTTKPLSGVGMEFLMNYQLPHIGEYGGPLSVSFSSSEHNQFFQSSFKQQIDSFSVDYFLDNRKKHQITAEYALRDEIPLQKSDFKPIAQRIMDLDLSRGQDTSLAAKMITEQRQASDAILFSAISSVKSSLKYLWTISDTRDSPANPTTGEYLQSSVELALPPGNVQFIKSDISAQFHRQIGPNYLEQPGLTFSLIGNVGLLYPLAVLFPNLHYFNKNRLQASTNPMTSFLSDR